MTELKDVSKTPLAEAVAAGKRYLTAEDIFAADDVKVVEVDVPEWGGVVRLRNMTGAEAVQFVKAVGDDKSQSAIRVVALCAVREDGSAMFTEDQLSLLQKKSLRALMRLQTKALEINGLDEAGTKAAKNA